MKHLVWLGVVAAAVLSIAAGAPAQKAPDGFFGLKWGDDIARFRALGMEEELGHEQNFQGDIILEGKSIFESKGESGKYYFYDGKFYRADFHLNLPESEFFRLKNILISKYGKPKSEKDLVYQISPKAKAGKVLDWTIKNVSIEFAWDQTKGYGGWGSLFYIYEPIMKKKDKKEQKEFDRVKDKL